MRLTYELDPPEAAHVLALVESVGRADGPVHARGHVISLDENRAVLEFPDDNWAGDVALLVSSFLAGEWADSAIFSCCRLVGVDWPAGLLPGPAVGAADEVLVGAIVKPSLGLTPSEAAETAAALAAGGVDLVKDDELLGDLPSCPLEERVRAVAAAIPPQVRYAANVTGPTDSLLVRAERAVELGAGALMVNAFAQGLDSVRVAGGRPRRPDLCASGRRGDVGAQRRLRGRTGGRGGVLAPVRRRLRAGGLVQRVRL
jgi:ribulose-bisphosphate carboxylase large chain